MLLTALWKTIELSNFLHPQKEKTKTKSTKNVSRPRNASCLFVCLFVCLFIYLSVFWVLYLVKKKKTQARAQSLKVQLTSEVTKRYCGDFCYNTLMRNLRYMLVSLSFNALPKLF